MSESPELEKKKRDSYVVLRENKILLDAASLFCEEYKPFESVSNTMLLVAGFTISLMFNNINDLRGVFGPGWFLLTLILFVASGIVGIYAKQRINHIKASIDKYAAADNSLASFINEVLSLSLSPEDIKAENARKLRSIDSNGVNERLRKLVSVEHKPSELEFPVVFDLDMAKCVYAARRTEHVVSWQLYLYVLALLATIAALAVKDLPGVINVIWVSTNY